MDLSFGPEYDGFRAEVRSFVAEHWTAAPEAAKCGTCRFRGICDAAVTA